ncbi:unnamed protein product [Prunus armeniaca]
MTPYTSVASASPTYGARSLAHKAIRQGYFWPSLHTDAQAFTQKCDKCQRFANISQLPTEPLTTMVNPWPH